MNSPTQSYKKVHYELRPAKQVERRMLIDALSGSKREWLSDPRLQVHRDGICLLH